MMCSTVLEEQPMAISARRAFSKAWGVRISLGRISCSSRFITCSPVFLASRTRAAWTAGMVPLPGRAMPMASVRQFMELAVYMPEQEPQVGQASSSSL